MILMYKMTMIEKFNMIGLTDSTRFMASLLSNLVDDLEEGIHKVKCKYGHDDKNVKKVVDLNTRIMSAVLNTKTLKMI